MARPLGDNVFVSRQIVPGDVAGFAARGVTLIVNNRPDGEEEDQPRSAEIEAAAHAAGLPYLFLPISDGFPAAKVAALGEALAAAEGDVLLFCRSGMRSTCLWALARARQGADVDLLVTQAARAGHDVRPLLPWLRITQKRDGR